MPVSIYTFITAPVSTVKRVCSLTRTMSTMNVKVITYANVDHERRVSFCLLTSSNISQNFKNINIQYRAGVFYITLR